MFKNLLGNLNQKKVKVFSLFLICSFFAWFLSNLSESYESRCEFELNYQNLPDSLSLGKNAVASMEGKLRTSGFQFLFYNFFSKQLNIDVSKAVFKNGHYVIEEALLKKEIDGQLSQNISLLDLDRNDLVIDLYKVDFKEIPIEPKVDIQFQQNFMLDGPIVTNPKTVVAKGPASEIDSLSKVETILIELNNIGSDFKVDAALNLPDGLKNTNFSFERVQLSGKAVKFSEEVFRLPVHAINLPSGYTVKIFPNTVSVLCKATVDRLKELSTDDFNVVADYAQVDDESGNVLYLELKKVPEQVFDIRLHEKTVTFVLEQE